MTDLDLVVIANDSLRLSFLPQVGGRLISLEAGGDELLWRNSHYLDGDLAPVRPLNSWPRPDGTMASWANVGGSKTWPAPQGWSSDDEWPGPPDDVLDAGPYTPSISASSDVTRLSLTSAADVRTGLQITRSFTVPATGSTFTQQNTFANTSGRPVRWSIWEVAQIDTALGGTFTVAGDGEATRLLDVVGVPSWTSVPGGIAVAAQDVVAKLGFTGASGRVTWRRSDGVLLEQSSDVVAGATYPDGGCPVELWLQCPLPAPLERFGGLHPDAHLVEMELLSPLVDLAPGARTTQTIRWRVDRGAAPPR